MNWKTIVSFLSIFQNANIAQKLGSIISTLLIAATGLYAVLPKIIEALTALSGAVGGVPAS
jgi:hypothetical protein